MQKAQSARNQVFKGTLEDPCPVNLDLQEAISFLTGYGIQYRVCSEYHIKIQSVNYYPTHGTIFIDKEKHKRMERGLEALYKVLKEFGIV